MRAPVPIALARFAVISSALLTLAACGGEPPPTPAPRGVVMDFNQPMKALGTEPFWGLTIQGTTLTLTRPDSPPLTAAAPGAVVQPAEASWTGKLADGRILKVTLYASRCSDGMSDRAYPFVAEVDLPGESPLSGCADTAAALAKAPRP